MSDQEYEKKSRENSARADARARATVRDFISGAMPDLEKQVFIATYASGAHIAFQQWIDEEFDEATRDAVRANTSSHILTAALAVENFREECKRIAAGLPNEALVRSHMRMRENHRKAVDAAILAAGGHKGEA